MKKTKVLRIGSLLVAFLFLVSGCGSASTGTSSTGASSTGTAGGTIKFAVAGPMTGDEAAQGLQMRNGAQIAVDEINANGGINGKKLEMTVLDDQGNPNQATVVAQKIVNDDNILFVLGHNDSGCSLAALPTYAKVDMPVISPTNTNPTLVDKGFKNYMRIIPSDAITVEQQTMMAIKELGSTKPAILYANSDYGKGCYDVALKTLDQLGVKPVGSEAYNESTTRDFSAQVTKFKSVGADVVLFEGQYTQCALFAKQNVSLGLNAKIIGTDGCANTKLMEIGGSATEGVFVTSAFDPNSQDPKVVSLVQKYQSKYNDIPGEWVAFSYDIVYMVKTAYEAGATTRDALIQQLHALKGFTGVTGLTELSANGDVPNKKTNFLQVKGNNFTAYKPTKF